MFHFKHFSISDHSSAMKIGTDAVLLGAWIDGRGSRRILDIGTGTGIIALMLAQRYNAQIEALEIDQSAAEEANRNVAMSSWPEKINVIHESFQQFIMNKPAPYDLILSNPPYFSRSLKPDDPSRSMARHNEQLTLQELLFGTRKILQPTGKAAFIFPADQLTSWLTEAAINSLYANRLCEVFPIEGKPAKRILAEFSPVEHPCKKEKLYIRKSNGEYHGGYKLLTLDYYLGL